MQSLFDTYIRSIAEKYSHTETSELGYRTDFEILLKGIFSSINVSRFDHDAKAKQGNKPDFVVVKDDVPLLYIETKDIGISLDKVEKSEQMTRYFGYANLILTDYVEFRFYRNGLTYGEPIKIAEYDTKQRTITSRSENFEYLSKTLLDFIQSYKEPIKSSKHLAKIMGGKAQRIRDNLIFFFERDTDKDTEFNRLYTAMKEMLVHDLTVESFADMYAQTLVYGLFVARHHDGSIESFSRNEARVLIPRSNPFLGQFFDHITGVNFDKRLGYIVDELCEVLLHADVFALLSEYKDTADPVIHFYEDFLKEYDASLRKKMGAYYTPVPVVQFIVRQVDILLKEQFGIEHGLASNETTLYEIETGQDLRADKRMKLNTKLTVEVPKVQILDPAVGTATFLNEIILFIHETFKGQEGRWQSYVYDNLLKRLHGFELMMTAYTIAHLKLGMTLQSTGIKELKQRIGVYLTNSLEEGVTIPSDLFSFGLAQAVNEESKLSSKVKKELPIMVVIGNPPYSVSSSNKGEWIIDLTKVYKENLDEKNIQPLSDDYIKFIRFAEHFIEKNGSGIVAMITNNSFLDGIIHRQMRKHLLETFDDIYILDLHGNSKKKETTPDGGKDENVFDIQQGVSINIFVRKKQREKGFGQVHHAELYGKRTDKFGALNRSDSKNIKWNTLENSEPYYFFVPKDFKQENEYINGFSINDLFKLNSVGIVTSKDEILINDSIPNLLQNIALYYKIIADENLVKTINYRVFDKKKIYYDTEIVDRARDRIMKHMLHPNVALIVPKQANKGFKHIFVADSVCDKNYIDSAGQFGAGNVFPLYLYNSEGTKTPNLSFEMVEAIKKVVGTIDPEDIFDYIYAVLHSPTYREKYKEFLKIDFPRVPYPKDKEIFNKLVTLGRELRELHLLESPKVNQFITTYPVAGSDVVEKHRYENSNVFINNEQYFGNVPVVAWNFWIGGYQPAQKWLKDRKGRQLFNEDIEHYQKMIVALTETDRIMKEIDAVVAF